MKKKTHLQMKIVKKEPITGIIIKSHGIYGSLIP